MGLSTFTSYMFILYLRLALCWENYGSMDQLWSPIFRQTQCFLELIFDFPCFFLNWLLNIWLIHNFKSVLFGGSNRQIQLMVFGSILLLVGALEHGWIMTFHSVGKFWTSQLTIRHIFQRGRAKNHQPDWFYGWIVTVTLKRLGGGPWMYGFHGG